MSLQRIKKEIYQETDVLFALAAADELAGDAEGYKEKLDIIGQICGLLGISTEVTTVTINLQQNTIDNQK